MLKEIIKPQNQCRLTGLESELECDYPAITHLVDNYRNVRLLVSDEDGNLIAGISLENHSGIYEVSGLYVEESHRRKGIARQLFGISNILYKNKVRHSDNLTDYGVKFVEGR